MRRYYEHTEEERAAIARAGDALYAVAPKFEALNEKLVRLADTLEELQPDNLYCADLQKFIMLQNAFLNELPAYSSYEPGIGDRHYHRGRALMEQSLAATNSSQQTLTDQLREIEDWLGNQHGGRARDARLLAQDSMEYIETALNPALKSHAAAFADVASAVAAQKGRQRRAGSAAALVAAGLALMGAGGFIGVRASSLPERAAGDGAGTAGLMVAGLTAVKYRRTARDFLKKDEDSHGDSHSPPPPLPSRTR